MISIVIVNWNSGALLEQCVRSLLLNAPGAQIILVDNGSADSSLDFAKGTHQGMTVLRNDRNIGFAAANNMGWRTGDGDQILFLNPDTECFPGSIDCLQQTLAADKGIWAVGGRLIGTSGKGQTGFNVRVFPTIQGVAAEMFFVDEIWPSNPWSGPHRLAPDAGEMDVDQPAAACLMVSRNALETVDGFDEAFRPAWFEDVDLCRRIRNKGGRIRYQPKARFLHQGGYSLDRMPRQDFLEMFHRNQIRYFQKHHGRRSAACVRKLIVAGMLMRSALSIAYPLAPRMSRTDSAKTFWNAARRIATQREASS